MSGNIFFEIRNVGNRIRRTRSAGQSRLKGGRSEQRPYGDSGVNA